MSTDTPGPEGSGASSRPEVEVVDLDAKRAARQETAERRAIRFGGRDWALVSEAPFEAAEKYRMGHRREFVALFLVAPGANGVDADTAKAELVEEFMALGPSDDDMEAVLNLYGLTLGKRRASSRP